MPATSAPTPHEAVRRQLAMQGQLFGSSLDAIAARTRQTSTDGVRAAFNHRELMRSWPMRGTIHVTTAEDHHWLRVALDNRRAAFKHRAETEFGVDEKLLKQAADIAFELIGEYGAVSRRTLVNEWARRGVVPADPHAAGAGHLRRSLIIWLHADGLLVQAPCRAMSRCSWTPARFPTPPPAPATPAAVARPPPATRPRWPRSPAATPPATGR